MSVLGELFTELGISRETVLEIVSELKKNPLGAMAMIQALNLSKEANQKIMEIVMMQPDSIDELASELGVSADIMDSIKHKIQAAAANK